MFYATVQNTEGGTKQYVRIQNEAKPNEEGKYTFSFFFDVKQKGSLYFSKEIKVTVEDFTTFGNDVWVEKILTPADFGTALTIDSYGRKLKKYSPESTNLFCSFVVPRKSTKLVKAIIEQEDNTRVYTPNDFHISLKNEGAEHWVVNELATTHQVNSGSTLIYKIDPTTTKLDLNRAVVIHVCIPTVKGGFIWNEWTLQPWEMGDIYRINGDYTKDRPCEEPDDEVIPPMPEKKQEKKEEKKEEKPAEKAGNKKSKEDIEVKTGGPPISERPEKVVKCNTDSLTKLLSLLGGKLCANDIKVSRGTTNSAMLLFDSKYTAGGNMFPLSGGNKITYHNKKNYLLSATLNGPATINQAVGQIPLKLNSKVEFSMKGIAGAKLADNTAIENKGVKLVCQTTSYEFDVEFDALGRLSSMTTAEDAKWSIGNGEVHLPAKTDLFFKGGYLARAKCTAPTEVSIAGQTFSVVAHKKNASLEFKKANELNAIVVGDGHTVEVAGYTVSVEAGSQLGVLYDGANYGITSVVTANPITVDVTKGSKVKSVDAKASKRLIIKEGKVVKVK